MACKNCNALEWRKKPYPRSFCTEMNDDEGQEGKPVAHTWGTPLWCPRLTSTIKAGEKR